MTWTFGNMLRLVGLTIRDPREGASTILSFAPAQTIIWQMLLLIVVVSIILGEIVAALVLGSGLDAAGTPFALSPFSAVFVHGGLLVLVVFAIHWIGRAFGGNGSFQESLLLMTWMQFIFVVLQVAQTIALLVLPIVAELIGIGALLVFFWLLTNFIAVIHGFRSLGMVFVGLILSAIGIVLGLSILLAVFGVSIPGIENV